VKEPHGERDGEARVTWRRVQLTSLDPGAPRFGVLVEEEGTGRALLALGAASEQELDQQLDACGGPVAYARRFGAEPLDPGGIAADDAGVLTFVPRG
jgi:hypothetical protein